MYRVADMHCDTIGALLMAGRDPKRQEETLRRNHFHVDLNKMRAGNYLVQNFALFVPLSKDTDPLEEVLRLADQFFREMDNCRDMIRQVRSFEDIERNRREGLMSALLTVEEGGVCKGEPAFLRILYQLGVRMLTLTWNFPNELGWPNIEQPREGAEAGFRPDHTKVERTRGLTEKGVAFVEEMERLGMIVDVSHLSDAGFYDVARITKKPFVASHSDARAVCPWCRNLDDDMIRLLAERGGVTGLNFCPGFLNDREDERATIASVAEHARHIVNVGGEDCLGLGSDFDGIPTHDELKDASCLPLLADALLKGGFSERQVDKIFSGNVLRVYREVLKQ